MSTFQQPTINGTAPGEETRKVCAQEVGWMFAKQYYNMMNSDPSRLYKFYGKKSTFIQGTEGEVVRQANGQQEIRAAIAASDFKDCRVAVSNVDTLPAIGDGILIQVLGKISFGDQAPRDFCQTFVLAEQPGGYYLHNNILRYLKEEVDEPDTANAAAAEPVVATAAPVEAPASATDAVKPAPAVPKDEKVDASEDAKADIVAAPKETAGVPSALVVEANPNAAAAVSEEKPASKPAVTSPKADTKPKAAKEKPVPAAAEAPVSNEAPKTEKPVAPVPSKPTSWANLAASESNKWGSKMANIEGTVAPASHMPTASPESSSRVSTPASGARDNRRRNEALSVFLKNIPQTATTNAIKDAFSTFGPIASVDYTANKTTSIVEFSSEAAKQKALRAGFVTVLANRVVVEERRSRSDTKQRRDGGNSKQSSGGPQARNGSGEFERVGSGRGSRSRTSTNSAGNAGNRATRGGKQ
ncbi:hypothetical protein IW140_001954 [Coemansia sp. RSA 1813]|nr:hypothetical protein EV178_001562 [Coemansia sp. RSA 1646]KAJ1771627.1 hypothetical protein LPJ74_002182 [Coemansia sp. RSA 1843]KAJ2089929.1 hypothetical protein IW138_003059 [Coemansia sp. RSA 986]KAJ2215245.1 hypothetical protein EV179_002333 [Coemansia sp. RSA 487]KAJ2571000.1 hypothetical protein IW140_001954 [Coemansia sp. RSA 1813]